MMKSTTTWPTFWIPWEICIWTKPKKETGFICGLVKFREIDFTEKISTNHKNPQNITFCHKTHPDIHFEKKKNNW